MKTLEEMNVQELRDYLKAKSMSTSGNKPDLLLRAQTSLPMILSVVHVIARCG